MQSTYLVLVIASIACWQCSAIATESIDFNRDWRFRLGELDAAAPDFADDAWRVLDLPHDWSVESSFSEGLEGCTGYLPGGVGWYRKTLDLDLGEDQVAYLCFDGVYNRSRVWLNGQELGFHPYGYSPFHYEITSELLRPGAPSVVAVRVDHSRYADSRWYTGSGIYRDVKLRVCNRLHAPVDGVYVTTPKVGESDATVAIETTVRNAYVSPKSFRVVTRVVGPNGEVVSSGSTDGTLNANSEHVFSQTISVQLPRLWSPRTPELYTAQTSIEVAGETLDRRTTRFGIRSIRFDADRGFFLNGESLRIQGVCLHHDGGAVGAAVPAAVWRRRLLALKEGGCNAVRSAHNPPSPEFLDLCDELGLLVQDEFYDEWDYPKDKRLNMQEKSVDPITRGHHDHFQEWAERDLKATVLRDRNHPCVFQWSIGNEIEWTYPGYRTASGYFDADAGGNYFWDPPRIEPEEVRRRIETADPPEYILAETAKRLAAWTRELDRTRPITANCILPSVSHVSGYADALDLVGYSYRRVVYDYAQRHFPDKPIMGTENLGQWHEWKAVLERPRVAGVFLWTGVDYLGEANGRWPQKGLRCGLLDTAGFTKPSYHMMKSLWTSEPCVYLATSLLSESDYQLDEAAGRVTEKSPGAWQQRTWEWHAVNRHWNYAAGETVVVEAYANADRLELLLNGRSLGVQSLSDFPDRIFKWAVPFEPGELVVTSASGAARDALRTAGPPARMKLEIDRGRIAPDGRDVAHVVAQITDEKGVPVRTSDREVSFRVDGPAQLIGVDNGSLTTIESFQSDRVPTHQGRCLGIVRSTRSAGEVTFRASTEGLPDAVAVIRVGDD
ncbi:glycoside hydrolase family 2 TIM barrel-domain containing protein [Botrimarina hoheduenensis]|uniref:Beta-galactosidase n=1 Tax=Botrimarina hoheduenensis TaxID=2528000 RepID=A0A5C5VYS4_9BACT|nr:glycoside hydrolase family 2 TIM barrel-domain containing protein [Botrimarina hoheduenensis]TWT43113.1 Beta-galactosidase [Botrimarina hoheduenensis]